MQFRPLTIGALYPGLTRGLRGDLLAAQALNGTAYSVCTAHVVAGRGKVTDVLNVPSDTVSAQLEHLRSTESPTAVKIGVVGSVSAVEITFEHVEHIEGPTLLDLTLSGPSGEDVLGQSGIEVLLGHLEVADLVTLRRTDASLVAGMEIPSLDDAQVAARRIHRQGAQHVLIRCGKLPTHRFDTDSGSPEYAADLYYDGENFALFEAPFLSDLESFHGASSAFTLSLLRGMQGGLSNEKAIQTTKQRVAEGLREAQTCSDPAIPARFFSALDDQRAAAVNDQ